MKSAQFIVDRVYVICLLTSIYTLGNYFGMQFICEIIDFVPLDNFIIEKDTLLKASIKEVSFNEYILP